jgi:5'(3')-deoxyribonucleotidase
MNRCFLDVDGVLADFTGGVHKKLGIAYDISKWPYAKGPKGWDFHEELGMSFERVSEICDFDFWKNLPWTADGRDILDVVLDHFFPGEITLLTTPMPNVMSASGKVAWITEQLPEFEKQIMVCTGSKEVLANVPDSVLIDDNTQNVHRWTSAGGKAVLVPRPWNIGWFTYEISGAVQDIEHHMRALWQTYS